MRPKTKGFAVGCLVVALILAVLGVVVYGAGSQFGCAGGAVGCAVGESLFRSMMTWLASILGIAALVFAGLGIVALVIANAPTPVEGDRVYEGPPAGAPRRR